MLPTFRNVFISAVLSSSQTCHFTADRWTDLDGTPSKLAGWAATDLAGNSKARACMDSRVDTDRYTAHAAEPSKKMEEEEEAVGAGIHGNLVAVGTCRGPRCLGRTSSRNVQLIRLAFSSFSCVCSGTMFSLVFRTCSGPVPILVVLWSRGIFVAGSTVPVRRLALRRTATWPSWWVEKDWLRLGEGLESNVKSREKLPST